jgi:hypothetical protein
MVRIIRRRSPAGSVISGVRSAALSDPAALLPSVGSMGGRQAFVMKYVIKSKTEPKGGEGIGRIVRLRNDRAGDEITLDEVERIAI